MDYFTISYLIYNFIIVLAIDRFMDVCFETRRTPLSLLIASFMLYYISTSLCFLFLDLPVITTVVGLLACFVITLNYQSLMKKRITSVICFYILLVSIETIVSCPFDMIAFDAFENIDTRIFSFTITAILLYITMCLSRRFENMKKESNISSVFWTVTIFITAFLLIILYLSIFYLPQIYATLVATLIITIKLLNFYVNDTFSSMYEDQLQSALYSQEREYYFSQCQLMYESVDKVKAIRHDIKFHLVTTRDYVANNEVDLAIEYLERLLGDIKESEPYSDTGNIAFDSTINYKLRNAEDEGIKVDINIFVPPVLNIEVVDIVSILGNLLDNALNAVALVEDKVITLDIEARKGNLFIKIANTFNPLGDDTAINLSNDGSTLFQKGEIEFGYGLRNVQKVVENYNGHLDIFIVDNVFTVGILLYTSESES